jgi:hypothetical protein
MQFQRKGSLWLPDERVQPYRRNRYERYREHWKPQQVETIAFDNAASSDTPAGDYSLTWSMTVNAGTSRMLVVAITGRYTLLDYSISTVTYGGVTMSPAINLFVNTMYAGIWYLVNPAVGTANVVWTPVFYGVGVWVTGIAMLFTGVRQAALELEGADLPDYNWVNSGVGQPTLSFATNSNSGQPLTTHADNCLVVDAMAENGGGGTMTAESNRVERMRLSPNGTGLASTILPKTPAGAVTCEWVSGDVARTMVGASFRPNNPVIPPAPSGSNWTGVSLASVTRRGGI